MDLDVDEGSSRNLRPSAVPVPPFHPSNLVADLNSILDISCKACNGLKVPFPLALDHLRWHGRINLLLNLGQFVRVSVKFEFGLHVPGSLKLIEHHNQTWEIKTQDCTSVEKCMGQFVTLVYSEGKRFKFGNKFVKRESHEEEEEEEYVFLGDSVGNVMESFFCLLCKDGGLWISSLLEGGTANQHSVHLNGVLLGSDQRNSIHFGDIISVYSTIESSHSCDFLFSPSHPHAAEEERSEDADMHMDLATFPELRVSLILYNLLTFLPVEQLKDLRHVSRLWNEEASKVLSGRDRLALTAAIFNRATASSPKEMAQMSNLTSASPHCLQVRTWKLDVPSFQSHEGDDLGAMKNMKLLQDVESLVLVGPCRVTQLHLFLGLSSTSQGLLSSLLGAVASSLVSLHLVMGMDFELEWDESVVIPLVVLQKLRNLEWRPNKRWNKKTLPLIHSVVASCTQITTLRLPFAGRLTMEDEDEREALEFSGEVIKKMAADVQLTELSVDCFRTPQLTLEAIKTFSGFSPGLRTLELFDLMAERRGRQTILTQEILDAWSGTLQELTLWYCDFGFASEDDFDGWRGIQMAFPSSMKKLEKLSIFVRVSLSYCGTGEDDLESDYGGPPPFFSFGDTRQSYMDYSRFPSLRLLTLAPRSHQFADHGEVPYELFRRRNPPRKDTSSFSDDDAGLQILPSGIQDWKRFEYMVSAFLRNPRNDSPLLASEVTMVDIPFQLNGVYHTMLDSLETVFPDCNFPEELEEARALRQQVRGMQ